MALTVADVAGDLAAFLEAQGQGTARLTLFTADASTRRYYRLEGQGLLLMEDRHDPVGFAAFWTLSKHLRALGLSAPEVYHADPTKGFALVEDFGDDTYATCLSQGADEQELYSLAIDALLHLHAHPEGAKVVCPSYGMETLMDALELIPEWYIPAIAPKADAQAIGAELRAMWAKALAPLDGRAEALVLRDFHIDNLMLLPGRQGVARCGILDFQDGVLGPSEYDVMSLLQDARRDVSSQVQARLLERYCAEAPAALGGAGAIRQRFALLGAQRHGRIMGLFIRLLKRDGKPGYLPHLPRVIGQFQQALKDAGLGEISRFLDRELPGWAEAGKALTAQDILG